VFENAPWDAESSNIAADPNPRTLTYIAAARLGAKVRVLLDVYFDNQDLTSPRSNLRTVEYLITLGWRCAGRGCWTLGHTRSSGDHR
jgi:hypothetical protein